MRSRSSEGPTLGRCYFGNCDRFDCGSGLHFILHLQATIKKERIKFSAVGILLTALLLKRQQKIVLPLYVVLLYKALYVA